jgi:hypothetical protein
MHLGEERWPANRHAQQGLALWPAFVCSLTIWHLPYKPVQGLGLGYCAHVSENDCALAAAHEVGQWGPNGASN